MEVFIEILAIGEPGEWDDHHVAFRYTLGIRGGIQEGWLVELLNIDGFPNLPSILAEHVNLTRPPSRSRRWLWQPSAFV